MSLYRDFRTALYSFMDTLDITSVVADGWAYKFDRLPKSDEMDDYPSFAIVPVRDEREIADNITDSVSVTFSVYVFVRYWDATDAEYDVVDLADLISDALSQERRKEAPLGGFYAISFFGDWGYDPDQVQRYYRLEVTARYDQDIQP